MKRDLSEDQLRQEVTVALPLSVLLRLNEEQPPAAALPEHIISLIGASWHGGVNAGLTIHDNQPEHLILLPGEFTGTHAEALAWAKEQGGELPSRFDQLVLRKNLPSEFKDAYYWSRERHADDADCAWGQDFGNGPQDAYGVSHRIRARAVRRIPIR